MKYLLGVVFFTISILGNSQDNVKVKTGDNAINFSLNTIKGHEVQLNKLNSENPLVLIVLRGWSEYQCPACSRQVGAVFSGSRETSKAKRQYFNDLSRTFESASKESQRVYRRFYFP